MTSTRRMRVEKISARTTIEVKIVEQAKERSRIVARAVTSIQERTVVTAVIVEVLVVIRRTTRKKIKRRKKRKRSWWRTRDLSRLAGLSEGRRKNANQLVDLAGHVYIRLVRSSSSSSSRSLAGVLES